MLSFQEWFYTLITTDTTMQTYFKQASGAVVPYSVYPAGVDITPEIFPNMLYQDVGGIILSAPKGMRVGMFQVDIWSNIGATQAEEIYTRLSQLMNFQSQLNGQNLNAAILWYVREAQVKNMIDRQRRAWGKSVTYKFWASNADLS